MTYDFDRIIDRQNTNSLKYDFAAERGKPPGLLPLWVADMDFAAPPEVTAAVKQTAEHGIYGYTEPLAPYYAALANWFRSRFGYDIERGAVLKTPGVVFALALAVRAFTCENGGVLIQSPVYYPFTEVIEDNNRRVFRNSLKITDGRYEIDFEDFESQIAANKIKLFILCSPHNPVGRVWTKAELLRMGEICLKNGCIIVSDEIHCDFVYPGHTHYILPSLSAELSDNVILCTAPSKTFNLAGLQTANIIIPNRKLRAALKNEYRKTGCSQLNTAGIAACEAAYTYGAPWLDALLIYLKDNLCFVRKFLSDNLPQIKLIEPEGTYLVWLDFRDTGIPPGELDAFITDKAKLWLDDGVIFGKDGAGFSRINIACPKKTLETAMERLKTAFDTL